MARHVLRKMVAEVCPAGSVYIVDIKTVAGESLAVFAILEGKDPSDWMRRMGWRHTGRSEDMQGEVWCKIVEV